MLTPRLFQLQQLAEAQADAQAVVKWDGWMIKRFRHDLWLHGREPFAPCPDKAWPGELSIDLGPDAGVLELRGADTDIPAGWRVGPRAPGNRIRVLEGGPSRKIKHYFQAASIPPWMRPGIPVLYWDDEPVALGDWVIGHRLGWWLVENGLELEWKPANAVLARVRRDCQS